MSSSQKSAEKIIGASKPRIGFADFEIRFIWWGLAITLFAGFSLGAYSIFVLAFGMPLQPQFVVFNQVHGHLQFIAWAGMFIVPISLHFIPRFAGIPLLNPRVLKQILSLMVSGLIGQIAFHASLPFLKSSELEHVFRILIAISSGLLVVAAILYAKALFSVIQQALQQINRPALPPVAPFFTMVIFGWISYNIFQFGLIVNMALRGGQTLDFSWNLFSIDLFLSFVLLPICFAFSIRTFPLYLRLPAIDWPVRRLAFSYLVATLLFLIPKVSQFFSNDIAYLNKISLVGLLLRNATILWLIWKIDVLTRVRESWLAEFKFAFSKDRKATRPGLPDYGEFGKFELLIYTAYFWLTIAAIFESVNAVSMLLVNGFVLSVDAVRHMYLMGFITHLILGMAPRMIPAFLHVKWIRFPGLVVASFYFATVAAFGRIVPLILPLNWRDFLGFGEEFLLGFSGVFAMGAIICLWLNLYVTIKHPKKPQLAQDGKGNI